MEHSFPIPRLLLDPLDTTLADLVPVYVCVCLPLKLTISLVQRIEEEGFLSWYPTSFIPLQPNM